MNLLHQVTKILKPHGHKKFLVGVSGGLDSMALFYLFLHFRKHFQFDFEVAHFHHGPSDNAESLAFRFKAHEFVAQACLAAGVTFHSNFDSADKGAFLGSFTTTLNSEAQMREARYQYFQKVMDAESLDLLVLGHHQDDLLETRLLRLIRGTGPDGLRAMVEWNGSVLRPLLGLSRQNLKAFLIDKELQWLEDPSNDQAQFLRNWVRTVWLPQLEQRQPGALKGLARSFDLLVENIDPSEGPVCALQDDQVILGEFLTLNREVKKQVLATYMKSQGLKDYGLSHVNEILKRLDTEKRSHTFRLLGRRWVVDAGRMSVQEPS